MSNELPRVGIDLIETNELWMDVKIKLLTSLYGVRLLCRNWRENRLGFRINQNNNFGVVFPHRAR